MRRHIGKAQRPRGGVVTLVAALTAPARLFTREEVLRPLSPAPAAPGLCAWFFREIPGDVPIESCVTTDGLTLLYVDAAPSRDTGKATIRDRLRRHYGGNAAGSTLRLTLGRLLGIPLIRTDTSGRWTFAGEGGKQLSDWLSRNAFVCWVEHRTPWEIEAEVIAALRPPLNRDRNALRSFGATPDTLRRDARKRASQATGPEVLILSQTRAETYEPAGREVCISVTDPENLPARLSARFAAILRLCFTALSEPSGCEWDVLFNEDHARQIVAFSRRWRHVDRIVIHCRAGLSRSPGIATGLYELFSWGSADDLQKQHVLCNRFVRRELVRVGRGMLENADD